MRPLKLGGLTLALIFGLVLLFSLLPAPWPRGEEAPAALPPASERRCEIRRDGADVPHISAPTRQAAFACLGRLHAEDRAWQMDYLRRVAYGRMAERYGRKHAKRDFMMRLVDLEAPAARWERELEGRHPKLHRLLSFYAHGVNSAFARAFRSSHQGRRAGYTPGAWRIRDSLIVALLQSFYQTRKTFTADLKHERLRRQLGAARYEALYGGAAERQAATTILKPGEHALIPRRPDESRRGAPPAGASLTPKALKGAESLLASLHARGLDSLGSNNWVVSGKRSASGHALLANDPHLDITTPSFWYEAHLKGPDLDVSGLTLPGLPAVTVGHNQHVAWGITNGYNNAADLIAVTRRGRDVLIGERRLTAIPHRPVVRIKIGPLQLPVFWKRFERTAIGPLLPVPASDGALLLRWTGYHLREPAIAAMIGLMDAKNVHDVDRALRRWKLPCFNIVFADSSGRIGYRQVGKTAKRATGRFGVLRGEDPLQWWQTFLDDQEMPAVMEPARGYVATANNRPFPRAYPFFLGHAFSSPRRARRIEELLAAKHDHRLEDMQRIQTDARDPRAELLLRPMLDLLGKSGGPQTPLARQARRLLEGWDLQARVEACAPTIFTLWLEKLQRKLVGDHRVDDEVIAAMLQGKRGVDARGLPPLVGEAFATTLSKLRRDLGPEITKWRWGRYHRIIFRPLEKGGPHPPSVAVHGSEGTVNVAPPRGPGPFEAGWGASYRLVIELGPRLRSFGVLAGRQRDRAPRELGAQQLRWARGEYRRRPFYDDELEAATRRRRSISF